MTAPALSWVDRMPTGELEQFVADLQRLTPKDEIERGNIARLSDLANCELLRRRLRTVEGL